MSRGISRRPSRAMDVPPLLADIAELEQLYWPPPLRTTGGDVRHVAADAGASLETLLSRQQQRLHQSPCPERAQAIHEPAVAGRLEFHRWVFHADGCTTRLDADAPCSCTPLAVISGYVSVPA